MKIERIIIADNQPLTALAIETLIRTTSENSQAGEVPEITYATRRYELNELLKDGKPTAVVIDYTLFDFTDQEAFCLLCDRYQKTVSWLLLSEELTPNFLRYVLYQTENVGVNYKDAPLDVLTTSVKYLLRGERYISHHAADVLLRQAAETEHQKDDLTQTERDVLKLIAQGKTTKEIAYERNSSIHTINSHRKNIFRKLGVNCAHDAMKYALRSGLIDETEFLI